MPTRSDADSARQISIGIVELNDEPAGRYYRARALRMNVDMRMGLRRRSIPDCSSPGKRSDSFLSLVVLRLGAVRKSRVPFR